MANKNSKTSFDRYVRFPLAPPRADFLILPDGPPSDTFFDPIESEWCNENGWPQKLATATLRKTYILDELRRHRRIAKNVPKHTGVTEEELGIDRNTRGMCIQMRNFIQGSIVRDWAMYVFHYIYIYIYIY